MACRVSRKIVLTFDTSTNKWNGFYPRDCGTHSYHVMGCRCTPCVKAHKKYLSDYYFKKRRNLKLSDPKEVTNHLRFLRSKGVSLKRLSRYIEVPEQTIYELYKGTRKSSTSGKTYKITGVTPGIAQLVLAMTPDNPKIASQRGRKNAPPVGSYYEDERIRVNSLKFRSLQ